MVKAKKPLKDSLKQSKFKTFDKYKGKIKLLKRDRATHIASYECNICKEKFNSIINKHNHACSISLPVTPILNEILDRFVLIGFTEKQIAQLLSIKKFSYNTQREPKGKKYLTVMSIDPGSVHAGVSVLNLWGNKQLDKIQVLESRLLMNTFKQIDNTNLYSHKELLLQELFDLVNKYKPIIICIERYQARGFSSYNNETVNLFIAFVIQKFSDKCLIKIYPPSGWKNRCKKYINLKQSYESIKGIILPHQLDSFLIGINVFPEQNPYSIIKNRANKLFKAIRKASWQI